MLNQNQTQTQIQTQTEGHEWNSCLEGIKCRKCGTTVSYWEWENSGNPGMELPGCVPNPILIHGGEYTDFDPDDMPF